MDNKSLNCIKDQNLFLKLGVKGTNENETSHKLKLSIKKEVKKNIKSCLLKLGVKGTNEMKLHITVIKKKKCRNISELVS